MVIMTHPLNESLEVAKGETALHAVSHGLAIRRVKPNSVLSTMLDVTMGLVREDFVSLIEACATVSQVLFIEYHNVVPLIPIRHREIATTIHFASASSACRIEKDEYYLCNGRHLW
jgi:hypothetical protein